MNPLLDALTSGMMKGYPSMMQAINPNYVANNTNQNPMPPPPATDPGDGKKLDKAISKLQDSDKKFGNWTGQSDVKVMAKDLMDRGLINANQLYNDNPNTNDPNAVRNAQSDWKTSVIQTILANAHRLNIRTPEALLANKNVLIDNPKYADAISNPYFNEIHPNFWQVIANSILPQQWAKFDKANKQKGMSGGMALVTQNK